MQPTAKDILTEMATLKSKNCLVLRVASTLKDHPTVLLSECNDLQGNLKDLSQVNMDKLAINLHTEGFIVPLFVWIDNKGKKWLIDGHQRRHTITEWYGTDVLLPYIPIPAENKSHAKKILLNITNKYGKETLEGLDAFKVGMDLADLFAVNMTTDFGEDFGKPFNFNDDENEQPDNSKTQAVEDDFQHPPPEEITTNINYGDLITFHKNGVELHRLLCGDSTKKEDVQKVMNNQKADLIFTDPPYGVTYTGASKQGSVKWEKIKNDNLHGDGLFLFLVECFTLLFEYSKPTAAAYIWYSSSNHIQFETALTTAGFKVRQQLIWNKGMVLGRNDYHWAHEPCLYCRKENERTNWYGDRTHKTILGLRRTDILNMKKDELVQIIKNLLDENTCWEIDRDLTNQVKTYQHPTQKPVTLAGRAINNNTQPNELVTDFFLGSGSTMVAAHQLNRKCYGLELSEKYCQVIINRMQNLDNDIEVFVNGVLVDKNLPF